MTGDPTGPPRQTGRPAPTPAHARTRTPAAAGVPDLRRRLAAGPATLLVEAAGRAAPALAEPTSPPGWPPDSARPTARSAGPAPAPAAGAPR